MLLSHIYEQKILSKEFITKQLGFEVFSLSEEKKKMYSLIVKNCTPSETEKPEEEASSGYHECAKLYKQKIKHFGLMTELLIQERSKVILMETEELREEITKTCQKLNQEDEILNCVNKATKNTILTNFNQDFEFLDLAREQILKNSTTKIN